MRQMRKWCAWYTKGFAGSAAVREKLARVSSIAEMSAALAELDADEPFPESALRAPRGKSGRTQTRVALPHGYLENLDDDTPPGASPEEASETWEEALSGG